MLIGISAVLRGRLADPAAVRALALAAEQLGYASLWVSDTPLGPEARADRSPAGPRARPPLGAEDLLDPLAVLANTAALTSRVRLGTRIEVDPGRGAAAGLVRALLSVDRLSDGRLTLGLALTPVLADGGGASGRGHDDGGHRGPDRWDSGGLAAVLDALHASPHRPVVLVAGPDPRPLLDGDAAGRVDGWLAAGLDPADLADLAGRWATARTASGGARTDGGAALRLVVHAPVTLTADPAPTGRDPYRGDLAQIAADLDVARRAGADEVVLGVTGDPGLDETLDVFARVAEAVEDGRPATAAGA